MGRKKVVCEGELHASVRQGVPREGGIFVSVCTGEALLCQAGSMAGVKAGTLHAKEGDVHVHALTCNGGVRTVRRCDDVQTSICLYSMAVLCVCDGQECMDVLAERVCHFDFKCR